MKKRDHIATKRALSQFSSYSIKYMFFIIFILFSTLEGVFKYD